jgi:hypothetical protein
VPTIKHRDDRQADRAEVDEGLRKQPDYACRPARTSASIASHGVAACFIGAERVEGRQVADGVQQVEQTDKLRVGPRRRFLTNFHELARGDADFVNAEVMIFSEIKAIGECP